MPFRFLLDLWISLCFSKAPPCILVLAHARFHLQRHVASGQYTVQVNVSIPILLYLVPVMLTPTISMCSLAEPSTLLEDA